MTTETKETIEELFASLDKKLQECKPEVQDYEKTVSLLFNYKKELQEKLEFANAIKKDDKELQRLYKSVAGDNGSILMDKLRGLGFSLKNKKPLKDAFDKAGYRLLEQTRAAKRDDVYYGILRIFISTQKEFPKNLVEPFKPIYSDEMFKVFIFSFLSGILQSKENEQ